MRYFFFKIVIVVVVVHYVEEKSRQLFISLLCGSGNSAVSVVGSFFEMCDDDVETSDEKKIVIGDHINDRRRFL